MPEKRILLDSNANLRLANSFHPLLHEPFGKESYVLYLIPEFQKEFDKNPRLSNKFGWVNQPEYLENRKQHLRINRSQKKQISIIYSYRWLPMIPIWLNLAVSLELRCGAFWIY